MHQDNELIRERQSQTAARVLRLRTDGDAALGRLIEAQPMG